MLITKAKVFSIRSVLCFCSLVSWLGLGNRCLQYKAIFSQFIFREMLLIIYFVIIHATSSLDWARSLLVENPPTVLSTYSNLKCKFTTETVLESGCVMGCLIQIWIKNSNNLSVVFRSILEITLFPVFICHNELSLTFWISIFPTFLSWTYSYVLRHGIFYECLFSDTFCAPLYFGLF